MISQIYTHVRNKIALVLVILLLFVKVWQIFAIERPVIWYHPDTYINIPTTDSISWTDEYTIFSVVRNSHKDSIDCLWSFSEDDTICSAILTKGIYTPATDILLMRNPRDFSHWCIYAYHSGIRLDSTKSHAINLGPHIIYRQDSTGFAADSLLARIEIEEFAYFDGGVSKYVSGRFQTYLALKYGITLDYAAYLSTSGDTIWHPIYDKDYYYRIIGIGNDTLHGWESLVSHTKEDAVLHIETDSLMPNEYVLIGDNDGPLDWQIEPDGRYYLARMWRIRQFVHQPKRLRLALQISSMEQKADSLRLDVMDESRGLYQLLPDSIIEDSVCYFSLNHTDTLMHLRLSGFVSDSNLHPNSIKRNDNTGDTSESDIQYEVSGNSLIVKGFPDDQIFTLYLYDSAGKIISSLSSRNPIDLSMLPNGIFYIEITVDNRIIGAIPIPANVF